MVEYREPLEITFEPELDEIEEFLYELFEDYIPPGEKNDEWVLEF